MSTAPDLGISGQGDVGGPGHDEGTNGTVDSLRDLASQVGAVVADAFGRASFPRLSDDDLLAAIDAAGRVLHGAHALLAEAAGEVERRSGSPERSERMTTRYGSRTTAELIERVTRISHRSALDIVNAGRAVTLSRSALTGESLPARYGAFREALATGAMALDAVVAVTLVLERATTSHEQRESAAGEIAASARGDGVDGMPAASADLLKVQAQVWATYLDPDGAEPRDERAQRLRGVTLGRCRDGLVPISGQLLPDAAGHLQRALDAVLNPAGRGPEFVDTLDAEQMEAYDPRAQRQKNHDALVTIVTTAAWSGELPTIGGAAPTLVVSVRAQDVASDSGVGHIDGIDEPVPMSVVRHVACGGGAYRVTVGSNGRPLALSISDRIFNAHQRKVIALRDGECIIPGCHVPAAWCEIHHVIEASRGGPTSTDNGVLLCWHHHRTLDSGGWRIRMHHGIPEVRGPAWWDGSQTWRPVTASPTRLRARHIDRVRARESANRPVAPQETGVTPAAATSSSSVATS